MGNVVSRVNDLNLEIKEQLASELSYTIQKFNGPSITKTLFNISTGMTYTGLIPHIISKLQKLNIPYDIIDSRQSANGNTNFKIAKSFKTRDYQQEIIDNSSSREVLQCATGGGKTFIIASLIAKFNVKPVLVIAPSIALMCQLRDEISKFLNCPVGIVGGGHVYPKDITVATPLSIKNQGFLVSKCQALFFDEAHHIPANTIFQIAAKATAAYYRIGLSATPWRDGDDDLLIEAALNIRKPSLNINASKLINLNMLTPCTINMINVSSPIGNWDGNYNVTYDKVITGNNNRNKTIIDIATNAVNNNRHILILVSKIEHGKILCRRLQKIYQNTKLYPDIQNNKWYDINEVEFLSGKDDKTKRQLTFDAVKNGFCKILIGTSVADEGLDLPILDCLILAGAGRSSTKAFQRIGRVLRLHSGKTDALVYDFIDSHETFYKQAMVRKALYETEPAWKINVL
jgi:superfamily II DNA or RNA helicase